MPLLRFSPCFFAPYAAAAVILIFFAIKRHYAIADAVIFALSLSLPLSPAFSLTLFADAMPRASLFHAAFITIVERYTISGYFSPYAAILFTLCR